MIKLTLTKPETTVIYSCITVLGMKEEIADLRNKFRSQLSGEFILTEQEHKLLKNYYNMWGTNATIKAKLNEF